MIAVTIKDDYTEDFKAAAEGVGFYVPPKLTAKTLLSQGELRVVMTLNSDLPKLWQVSHSIGTYETCMFDQRQFHTRLGGILLQQARMLRKFLEEHNHIWKITNVGEVCCFCNAPRVQAK